MKLWLTGVVAVVAAASVAAADSKTELAERFRKATSVLTEMASGRDPEIPRDVLAQARAVAVFPGVTKAAIIIGGRHGEGVASVKRTADGAWSAPASFTIGGGSVGLQLGGQVMDLVLLVMTDKGVDSLLRSEFTLGADASLAAGPKSLHEGVGTDGRFKAEVFSYAKASGFFAGVSLEGSSVAADGGAIRSVYGERADSRDVLLGTKYAAPAMASGFMTALRAYSPHSKKP
jgi:lipid-binding SYLF domain-containing protein